MTSALFKPMILVLGIACFCGQAKERAEQVVADSGRYDSVPGSKVTIQGNSNISDWRAEGNIIVGFLEVGSGFPQLPPGGARIKGRAELFIPVKNLKAVGRTWEPDNEQITTVMQRTLRAQDHPRISFSLSSLTAAPTERSTDSRGKFDAIGDLVIAGVTNTVSMPVSVEVVARTALRISGKTKVKQSDFKLRPPSSIMDWFDNDTVSIEFEWRVAQKE